MIVPAVPFATAGRPAMEFLQNILFTGVARAALIFIGLRVVVYSNSEFDEKTDGIVYGAAIGLGTAAAANMASALGHDGLWLGSAGYDFVVNTLSGACSGAFIGYGLAKAKFEGIGAGLVLPFLLIAAIIEGATRHLAETYAVIGLSHGSVIKLVLAVSLCLVAFASLFILARLENRDALSSVKKGVAK
jgi:RsiW-degrading membrane proteinase PrsW (M82 family)